jgi:hypothetical protein
MNVKARNQKEAAQLPQQEFARYLALNVTGKVGGEPSAMVERESEAFPLVC